MKTWDMMIDFVEGGSAGVIYANWISWCHGREFRSIGTQPAVRQLVIGRPDAFRPSVIGQSGGAARNSEAVAPPSGLAELPALCAPCAHEWRQRVRSEHFRLPAVVYENASRIDDVADWL